jgi:hypothetical protein
MNLHGSMLGFPNFDDSQARVRVREIERLMDVSLSATQYINAKEAARLVATLMQSYRRSLENEKWASDLFLMRSVTENRRFNLVCAAVFDLVSNMAYLHDRLVNARWIYCSRSDQVSPRKYYSFLKQCPRCCLDKGLESRLTGAQHKPSSHHIGEITGITSVLILKLLGASLDHPLSLATIQKQSHDTDAIAFRSDVLVLFEIKASPLVTFSVAAELEQPMVTEGADGEKVEYKQHSLVDHETHSRPLHLFIPHRDIMIPLGTGTGQEWPFTEAVSYFSDADNFLDYLSAWLELYYAYSIPKTQRLGRTQHLTYLVNGWGDEIDSNKTKPGLGRTDDLKKGTYQMLKFGAYYRDTEASLQVRSALVANIDPVFLKAEYLDGLKNVRWGKGEDFSETENGFAIDANKLRYLYEAVLAFNEPLINDPLMRELFDFQRTDQVLIDGGLNELLSQWSAAL